jgi:hypothetical protein
MEQGGARFEIPVSATVGPEGGPFLYIWGAVCYRDGFDESPARATFFCHRYNYKMMPSGDPNYLIRPGDARIHRYGNDAT